MVGSLQTSRGSFRDYELGHTTPQRPSMTFCNTVNDSENPLVCKLLAGWHLHVSHPSFSVSPPSALSGFLSEALLMLCPLPRWLPSAHCFPFLPRCHFPDKASLIIPYGAAPSIPSVSRPFLLSVSINCYRAQFLRYHLPLLPAMGRLDNTTFICFPSSQDSDRHTMISTHELSAWWLLTSQPQRCHFLWFCR